MNRSDSIPKAPFRSKAGFFFSNVCAAVLSFICAQSGSISAADSQSSRQSSTPNGGAGFTFNITPDGQFVVAAVMAGGPASQAGIKVGDILLAVEDKEVKGLSGPTVVKMIAGSIGTKVNLRLRHPLGGEAILAVTRAKLPLGAASPTDHSESRETQAAGALPAEKSKPLSTATLHLRKFSVIDTQGAGDEAYSLLAPVDWQVKGEVRWQMERTAAPADLLLLARNPKGSEEFRYLPALLFVWSPMLEQAIPVGQKVNGCEIARPLAGPLETLRGVVLPRLRPEVRNYRMVAEQELPALAQAAAPLYQRPGMQGAVRAGRVRVEYPEGGRVMQEEVTCIFLSAQGPGGVTWGLDQITSAKAEKGLLDEERALFRIMATSLRPNLKWFNEYSAVTQLLIEGFYRTQAAIMERVRIQSQANREISEIIRRTYESRQAAMDRIAENYDQKAIRGVQARINPFDSSTVEVPSEYEHAWTNPSGEYIYSHDPNFNPNLGSNKDWRIMQTKN